MGRTALIDYCVISYSLGHRQCRAYSSLLQVASAIRIWRTALAVGPRLSLVRLTRKG